MKTIYFIIVLSSLLFSCEKEKQPPAELLGKWKMMYKKHKIFDAGGTITWTDTITTNNKTLEFFDNWEIKSNKYFPNCIGDYNLSNNNKIINISFECNTIILDYTIVSNTSEELIFEKDDGIDIFQEIYKKE